MPNNALSTVMFEVISAPGINEQDTVVDPRPALNIIGYGLVAIVVLIAAWIALNVWRGRRDKRKELEDDRR